MGWSATAGEVDNFIYEDANSVFIADEDMRKRYSLYLLYWCKSTNTDVWGAAGCWRRTRTRSAT